MHDVLSPLMLLVHGSAFALLLLAAALLAVVLERALRALVEWTKASGRLKSLLEAVALCLAGVDLGLYLKLVIVHALPLLVGGDGAV